MTGTACRLDAAERAAQLERYRALGRRAAEIRHEPRRVNVRFADPPPPGLLGRTLEVERRCCPFFDIRYEPDSRRLVIGVGAPDRGSDLDAIAAALIHSRTSASVPAMDEPTSAGQLTTSCCGSAALDTCCDMPAKEDCCGHSTVEPPSRCGCR